MLSRHTLVRALSAAFAILASVTQTCGLDLPFALSKPAGTGPFPAVVILHDCSGLGLRSSGAPRRWAADLLAQGYVTMIPDSFSSRGRPSGVCADPTGPRVPFETRRADAYAALAFLQTLSFVDARHIAVMGGSHGGSSTLATIAAPPVDASGTKGGFAAAVALYPACGHSFGDWTVKRTDAGAPRSLRYSGIFKPVAPLLILIGDLDDWTPADPCRELAQAAQAAGYPVELKVYPGAYHSFDSPAPKIFRADRINRNMPLGRGATTAGNPEAWADARSMVHRFLSQHLRAD